MLQSLRKLKWLLVTFIRPDNSFPFYGYIKSAENKDRYSLLLCHTSLVGVPQVGLIESLLRSEVALCLWSVHDQNIPDADEERGLNQQTVIDAVMAHQFWNDLSDVLLVMEVIHEQ